MASLAQVLGSILHRVGESVEMFGGMHDGPFVSLDGNISHKTFDIAVSTAKLIFDGSADEIATVKILAIRAEQTGILELTFDSAGTYGIVRHTYEVLGSGVAGEYGPALIIPNVKAYANYTSPFGGGTLVYADRIRFKNMSSTEISRIEIFYGA